MISAVFRRGGDVTFVADELKAVFDPQGGHWVGGRYVPSLLAAIGEVIETHMRRIGFLQSDEARLALAESQRRARGVRARRWRGGSNTPHARQTLPPLLVRRLRATGRLLGLRRVRFFALRLSI